VIQGKHQHRPQVPFTPGGEWSGIIKAVGSEIAKNGGRAADGEVYKVGDRVFGGAAHHAGCWSETYVVEEVQKYRIFKLPEELTLKQSVNVMANYSTAWAGLVLRGNIKKSGRLSRSVSFHLRAQHG
jgi:NADPH2:quinone reductase